MVRIASFNVENLFARPNAFRSTDMTVAEPVLAAYAEVNELIKQPVYSDPDKARIRNLLVALDIYTWIIILTAIFSWLYAFGVVNPSNQVVATIGRML